MEDFTAPTWIEIPQDQTIALWTNFVYDVNATDAGIGLESYAINDSNFVVNSSGWVSNNTNLAVNLYYLNLSINDTLGNSNSSIFYVNVTDITVPEIVITSPLAQTYTSSSIDFNITSNENLSSCKFTLTEIELINQIKS